MDSFIEMEEGAHAKCSFLNRAFIMLIGRIERWVTQKLELHFQPLYLLHPLHTYCEVAVFVSPSLVKTIK